MIRMILIENYNAFAGGHQVNVDEKMYNAMKSESSPTTSYHPSDDQNDSDNSDKNCDRKCQCFF